MNRSPPSDRPPAYALPLRYYRSSLRPVVLITTGFGTVWSIAAGVSMLKNSKSVFNTTTLNSVYLALGIMYLFVGSIELFGFGATFTQRVGLVKNYFFASVAGGIVVVGAELARLIVHFVHKTDIINACVNDQMSENNGTASDLTLLQAQSLCGTSWQNSTYTDIGLLIVSILLSALFISFAGSYLHQLLNPQSMRTHETNVAPSAAFGHAYPLAPYPQGGAGEYNQAFVPPPYGGSGPPGYERSGYEGDAKEKEFEGQREGYSTAPAAGGFGEEVALGQGLDGRHGEGRV